MKKWKIIEAADGTCILKEKRFGVWWTYEEDKYGWQYKVRFDSVKDAEVVIKREREYEERNKKRKAVVAVHKYPPKEVK